jgi:hypothetical protein
MPSSSRTADFKAAVERERLKASTLPATKQRLLANNNAKAKGSQRTEFTRQAAQIGRDIQQTAAKLEKLAQCASAPRSLETFAQADGSGQAQDSLR